MKIKFDLQFFGVTTQQVPTRGPEPEYLKRLRNKVYSNIDAGLDAYDPSQWNRAKEITNNALNQQNSLLNQIPGQLNQSNSILTNIQNLANTGELPSGITDKLNSGVAKDLNNSMGSMLNNLASRGVVNSSITGQGISRLGQQAADAYNRNYLNAFNSVLNGQATALNGSQGNLSSLLSSLSAVSQMPNQAYEGAAAGIMPAYNLWKALQSSYDNRTDYDTIAYEDGGFDFCVTGDTLVTIKDGTSVPVSELQDDDLIQCWDFDNGCITFAPLTAFFKRHDDNGFNVIRIKFDDGSSIGVIYAHLFFDLTLGKFVSVNSGHTDFIGHEFAKLDAEGHIVPVKVTGIDLNDTVMNAYSPHCEGYLNFFANGLLTGTEGLLGICNMFDFDTEHMMFIPDEKIRDLNLFGRLGYASLQDLVSEEFFFNNHIDTFAVAFGKGLTTLDEFRAFISKFSHCFIDHKKEG